MLTKFSGLDLNGPHLSLEKQIDNFCDVLTYSLKRAREIRKFHIAIVQRWLRNVQKSVMHVQSGCFANIIVLLFCCSLCLRCSRCFSSLVVVIQKFCYRGNMTSHFSFLFAHGWMLTKASAHNASSNPWRFSLLSNFLHAAITLWLRAARCMLHAARFSFLNCNT